MTGVDVLDSTVVEVPPVHAVQFTTRCAADPVAINAAMRQAFAMVMPFIARNKLAQTGPPRAIYSEFNPNETCFTLAIPIASASQDSVQAPPEGVSVSPPGRSHAALHASGCIQRSRPDLRCDHDVAAERRVHTECIGVDVLLANV